MGAYEDGPRPDRARSGPGEGTLGCGFSARFVFSARGVALLMQERAEKSSGHVRRSTPIRSPFERNESPAEPAQSDGTPGAVAATLFGVRRALLAIVIDGAPTTILCWYAAEAVPSAAGWWIAASAVVAALLGLPVAVARLPAGGVGDWTGVVVL